MWYQESFEVIPTPFDTLPPGPSSIPPLTAHQQSSLDRRTCPICFKRFYNAHKVTVHLRTHTNERPFQCPLCDYRAAQKVTLQTHMKRHNRQLQLQQHRHLL
ncbi:zinc finger protein-like [Tropilaelaps mercedesae]|uniref:Zinc finger protein-like n=1 Tax=Tropilaelaps mercedesae TaxID=418985 RepID=A0A1V9X9F2_9ACAR|nr:zinc finger protein-like [Tropilaelaps mercedesae]